MGHSAPDLVLQVLSRGDMLPTLLVIHTRVQLAYATQAHLLTHVQFVHQAFFAELLARQLAPSLPPALLQEVFPSQMQGLVLALVALHEILVSPFLWPVQVPLTSSSAIQCIDCLLQVSVILRLAERALCHPGC